MIQIIEIYTENNVWYVRYLIDGYTHISEPVPTEEMANEVKLLLLKTP